MAFPHAKTVGALEREIAAIETFLQQDWEAYYGALGSEVDGTPEWAPEIPTPPGSRRGSQVEMHMQMQSSLFTKLPGEVRELIWSKLNLIQSKEVEEKEKDGIICIQGQICLYTARKGKLERCNSCMRHKDIKQLPEDLKHGLQLLALPLACKRTYFESIKFLYLLQGIRLNRAAFVQKMPTMLPPGQFQGITSLTLSWSVMAFNASPKNSTTNKRRQWDLTTPKYSSFAELMASKEKVRESIGIEWKNTWKVLSSMKGLEKLMVSYHIDYSLFQVAWLRDDGIDDCSPLANDAGVILAKASYKMTQAAKFWNPVKEITAPKDFRLYIDGWVIMFLQLPDWSTPSRIRFHNFYYPDEEKN